MYRKIRGFTSLLFLMAMFAALSSALAAEMADPQSSTFSLEGVTFKYRLPEGFCAPTGKAREAAESIASIDQKNMTHFTIVLCREMGSSSALTRWGMMKTPRSSIGRTIPARQAFILDFKNNIKNFALRASLNESEKLVGKTFKDVFGIDAKIGMHMEPIEADDYAGYLGGTISLSLAGKNQLTACVGAMTIVREHVFFYYKYSQYTSPADIADLLKQVKDEVRLFVVDNGG